MATTMCACIYARGEVSFAKFLFLPSWFAKLLEANFSCFAKIIWMPSWFAKLLPSTTFTKALWCFSQQILHKLQPNFECRHVSVNKRCCRLTTFFINFLSKFEMPIYMKVVSLDKLDNFHKGRF
jgi:hypothetical protein